MPLKKKHLKSFSLNTHTQIKQHGNCYYTYKAEDRNCLWVKQ
jgi:hypothetical protein